MLVVGRTVVFGADTGVCVQGHVILRHDVIADHWLMVCFSLTVSLMLVILTIIDSGTILCLEKK